MIRLHLLRDLLIATAILLLIPFALGATKVTCPPPGQVTEDSYTWDFSKEVTDTLELNEQDALQVRLIANELLMLARAPTEYAAETHGEMLMRARAMVNRMSDRMCRLLKVQRVVPRWQQTAINNVEATLRDMVMATEGAIEFFDGRKALIDLYSNEYRSHLERLYDGAADMCRCTEPALEGITD